MAMEKIYTLTPDGYKQQLKKGFPQMVIRIFFLVGMSMYFIIKADMLVSIIFVVFLTLTIIYSVHISRKRMKESWEGYKLIVRENEIIRVVSKYPTMTIAKSEISAIEEDENGNLYIKTAKANSFIFIWSSIINPLELREDLQTFLPITPRRTQPFQKTKGLLLLILLIVLLVIFFVSSNKWVVIVLGSFALAFFVWAYHAAYKYRKFYSNRIYWSIWLSVPAVLCLILPKMLLNLDLFEISTQRNIENYNKQADLAIEERQYETAVLYYDTLLTIVPKDAKGFRNRGYAYYHLEEYEKAETDINKSLQIDSQSSDAHLYKAYISELKEDMKNAEKEYTESIKYSNKQANAYFYRGYLRLKRGDKQGACTDWQTQLKLGDDSSQDSITKYCR